MALKIGIDTRELERNPAGVGMYVLNLMRELSSIPDIREIVAFHQNDFHPALELPFPKISWVPLAGPSFLWHLKVAFQFYLRGLDLYHSPHSLILPIILGRRSVITVHDVSPLILPKFHTRKVRLFYNILLGWSLMRAKMIISDSENTSQDLSRLYPGSLNKIRTIHLGVTPPAVKWKWNATSSYLLYIGTLEPRKNITLLLKALRILRTDHPQLKLVVGGKRGWYYQEIFEELKDLKLEEIVDFRGYLSEEEKWELLSRASVFVFPSWYEGFGLPVLEAMSAGVPIISSQVSSLSEVVGEGGILLNPSDLDGFVAAIKLVLSNRTLAQEMSLKALQRSKLFSWKETARKTFEVYQDVVT